MTINSVVVGMSGGVDSSVCVGILLEQGYNVVGCTFKMFDDKKTDLAITDAQNVAKHFNIQHKVIDCRNEFQQYVIQYFIDSYKNGHTPNPCIMCNALVKFKLLNEFRKKNNLNYLATGHYVQLKTHNNIITLQQASAEPKDQSYFLYLIDRDILLHTIFPLGDVLSKAQTREYAKKYGLYVAEKKDSQDICFISTNYIDFIKNTEPSFCCEKGMIIDENNKILGSHDGAINFTIGQRKGLNVSNGPFFVKNINNNTVVVSNKDGIKANQITLDNVQFINDQYLGPCLVKIRSSHKKHHATLCKNDTTYYVRLLNYEYGVASGQHCVFFDKNIILGGGVITNSLCVE